MHDVVLSALGGALREAWQRAGTRHADGPCEQMRLSRGRPRPDTLDRVGGPDLDLLGRDDVAGVDAGIDEVNTHRGHAAIEDRPLDHVHTPVLRQRPLMRVERADPRNAQDICANDRGTRQNQDVDPELSEDLAALRPVGILDQHEASALPFDVSRQPSRRAPPREE